MATVSRQEVEDYIYERAAAFGIDPNTAVAILRSENSGAPGKDAHAILSTDTVSPRGALGPMQVMPSTRGELIKQKYLPADHDFKSWQGQTDAGLAAISEIVKRNKTDDPLFIAAEYNGGPTVSRQFVKNNRNEDVLNPETANYIKKMKAILKMDGTQASPSQADVRKSEPGGGTGSFSVAGNEGGTSLQAARGADAILNTLETSAADLKNLVTSLYTSRDEQAAALKQQGDAIARAGQARAEKAAVEGTIDAANVGLRQRIVDLWRMGTDSADSLVAESLARRTAIDAERKPLAAEIDARMSVGFFDDPLQWLVNQTVLPGQVSKHNALAREHNNVTRQVNIAQTEVANQEKIDVGATADMAAARADAIAKMELANAQEKVAGISAQVAGTRAQTALQVAQLGEAHSRIVISSTARIEDLQRKAAADVITKKERDELERINGGIKTLGESIGAPNASLTAITKLHGKAGQDAWVARVNTGKLGDNLHETLSFIETFGNLPNMAASGKAEQAASLKKMIDSVNAQAKLIRGGWSLDPKNAGQKAPDMNTAKKMAAERLEAQWAAEAVTDMGEVSATNPYAANHRTMALTFADKTNPVYQMVANALNDNIKITDRILFKAVEDAVKAGTLERRAAAVAITDYYKAATAHNNKAQAFTLLGLPAQQGYVVRAEDTELKVDLTNDTSVERFLTQQAASMKALKYAALLSPAAMGVVVAGEAYNMGQKYMDKRKRPSIPSAGKQGDAAGTSAQIPDGVSP